MKGSLRKKIVNSRSIMAMVQVICISLPCYSFNVSVKPASPVGGQGVLLTLTSDTTGYYELSFNGKTYTPYDSAGNTKEIFLPVKIEDRGKKKIKVSGAAGQAAPEEKEIWINVVKRVKSTVLLKEKDEKLRSDEPIIEDQNRLLLEKIRFRSLEKLWNDKFEAPLKAPVTTKFALQRKAKSYQYYHKGIDYSAPEGTAVKASNDGKVIYAKTGLNVYGNTLVVDHGQGIVSCYFHLSKILKNEGERVVKGETIGEVGSTGWATGPHLHFGVYLQGEAVDPLWWIKFSRAAAGTD